MHRRTDLSLERLKEAFHYDPETGVFTWLVNIKAGRGRIIAAAGSRAGSLNSSDGYIYIGLDKKRFVAQRLAWLYMTGCWPIGDVDHENGDGSNNKWTNLRDISHAANLENQRVAQKSNLHGYLGVSWQPLRSRWLARICVKGRQKSLGYFRTAEAAHDAYLTAKRSLHEGYTI